MIELLGLRIYADPAQLAINLGFGLMVVGLLVGLGVWGVRKDKPTRGNKQ